MHNTPSRREKRESKFYLIAENGEFCCKTVSLFKSEVRTLVKNGFDIQRYGENESKSLPAEVSWEHAFKSGIPLIVFEYIEGNIQTFPTAHVENWAQELYVIAARANKVKAQTNNE